MLLSLYWSNKLQLQSKHHIIFTNNVIVSKLLFLLQWIAACILWKPLSTSRLSHPWELSNAVFSMEHCSIKARKTADLPHKQPVSHFPNASLHASFKCCSTVAALCWWLYSLFLPLLSLTWLYCVTFSSPVHCFCLISWYMDMHGVCCGFYYVKTTFLWPPLSGSFGSALIPVIDSFFDAFSKINSQPILFWSYSTPVICCWMLHKHFFMKYMFFRNTFNYTEEYNLKTLISYAGLPLWLR